jgi:hypothetical protein
MESNISSPQISESPLPFAAPRASALTMQVPRIGMHIVYIKVKM